MASGFHLVVPVVNGFQESVLLTRSVPAPEWIPELHTPEGADSGFVLHQSSYTISLDLKTLLSIQAAQRKNKLAWLFTRKCLMCISFTDMNLGQNLLQLWVLYLRSKFFSGLWISLWLNTGNKIWIQKSCGHILSPGCTVCLSITFWCVSRRTRTKFFLLLAVSQRTKKYLPWGVRGSNAPLFNWTAWLMLNAAKGYCKEHGVEPAWNLSKIKTLERCRMKWPITDQASFFPFSSLGLK